MHLPSSLPPAFAHLQDPRRNNARHPFGSILFIALCAVIAGSDSFEDIEQWGKAQELWLRRFVPLPHGIACADTFLRLFAALNPLSFQAGFVQWTRSLAVQTQNEVIAIDGKTHRASANPAQGIGALHLVSAWAASNRLILAQEAVEDKENEILAIPRLLSMLELHGCIVTIDAMGCHKEIAQQILKEIAQQILSEGGDYILSLKDNHPTLHTRVRELFESERSRRFVTVHGDRIAHSFCHSYEKDHGRDEHRRCWVIGEASYLDVVDSVGKCFGFKSVVCIETEFIKSGKVTKESRYYLTSLSADADMVLKSRRQHWGIENSVHWVLDVVFDEDRCRVREQQARENLAILRHVALNLIRGNTTLKGGIAARRKLAAWNTDNLQAILNL